MIQADIAPNATPAGLVDALYRALRTELLGYFRPRVGDAAEDLLHEAFVRLHRRAADLPGVGHLRGFIYRIARNLVADHHRGHSRPLPRPEDLPVSEAEADGGLDAYLARSVPLFIDALPEADAEALRLVELEGMSQVELAQHLGLSVSGAKSRVQRARRRLRAVFEACCAIEADRYGQVQTCVPHAERCAC